MFDLLHRLLTAAISDGHLIVIDHKGISHTFGDGRGDIVVARTHTLATEWRLALDPETHAGDAYVDGTLTVEQGSLPAFLDLIERNFAMVPPTRWARLLYRARRALASLHSLNPIPRAKRNVAAHYDLDPRIYDLFLDRDRQYSCAYFTPGAGLEEAQASKKRHIASKLRLDQGQRVLDIGSGCGWACVVSRAERRCGRHRHHALGGATHVVAGARAEKPCGRARAVRTSGLSHAVGPFDRIVSVGMFEHVGLPHYRPFFDALHRNLAPDGVALLHTIGRLDGPYGTNPFIRRHIFPGGHLPALSEIMDRSRPHASS